MRESDPVLLVEDDPIDIGNLQRLWRKLRIANPLVVARQGEEALQFLRNTEHAGPRPALILLDLNMPVMGGLELIRTLKADPSLGSIPMVVLTTSSESREIERCLSSGVAGYFIKPIELKELEQTIRAILTYWRMSQQPAGTEFHGQETGTDGEHRLQSTVSEVDLGKPIYENQQSTLDSR